MRPILYIETNFAVGIARGQNVEWSQFLDAPENEIELFIPAVCFMEVLSNLESVEKKRWGSLRAELEERTKHLVRDLTSQNARKLVETFEKSLILSKDLEVEMIARFEDVLERIADNAKVIKFDVDSLKESINTRYLNSPTDNLILCTVLAHARGNPGRVKAFLSANTDDFKSVEVEDALKSAGVKYFSRLDNALGWIRAERQKAPAVTDDDVNETDSDEHSEP